MLAESVTEFERAVTPPDFIGANNLTCKARRATVLLSCPQLHRPRGVEVPEQVSATVNASPAKAMQKVCDGLYIGAEKGESGMVDASVRCPTATRQDRGAEPAEYLQLEFFPSTGLATIGAAGRHDSPYAFRKLASRSQSGPTSSSPTFVAMVSVPRVGEDRFLQIAFGVWKISCLLQREPGCLL